MPAIEDGRAVTAGFPAPPGRPPALIAGFIPVLTALAVASLVRSTLESLFSFSIAHGWLVSRMPNNGNLGPRKEVGKGGYSCQGRLTLPHGFRHKRANREPVYGRAF